MVLGPGGKDADNEEKTQYFRFGKTDDGEWETAYSGETDTVVKQNRIKNTAEKGVHDI